MKSLPTLLLTLGAALVPAAASAQTRVALVIEETVDGQAHAPSDFERALAEKLVKKADVILVETDQLARLRKSLGAGAEAFKDVITSVEADVIIQGHAELAAVEDEQGLGVWSYEAKAGLRVYATDTAEILAEVRIAAQPSSGVTRMQAWSQAVGQLADRAAAKLASEHPDALRRGARKNLVVTLRSDSPVSAAEIQSTLESLRSIAAVDSARLLQRDRKVARMGVAVRGGSVDTAELALEIESAAIGLVVMGQSGREVLVELDPSQGAKLPLRVQPFGRSPEARLTQDFAADALLGLGFLQPETRASKSDPKLVLTGRLVPTRGGDIGVRLRATLSPRGQPQLSVRGSCPRKEFARCAAALSGELAGKVEEVRAKLQSGRRVSHRLELVELESPGIFPGRLGHYLENPFATVVLKNSDAVDVEKVVVRVKVPGLADEALETEPHTVKAGSELRIPVRAVFDRSRLEAQSTTEMVLASVEIRYRSRDLDRAMRTKRPVMVFEAHAMEWQTDRGASVAGFVDSHAIAVRRVADHVQARLSKLNALGHPLALPVAVSLALRDLTYTRDPKNPFDPGRLDYVRFPDETLHEGRGDCDDLSVAFASVIEAAGGSALLLLTPSHVFVAVGTGLSADRAPLVSLEKGATLNYRGELYVPIEATALHQGFMTAWEQARLRMGSIAHPPAIIDLARVRHLYPAAALKRSPAAPSTQASQLDEVEAILTEVDAAQSRALRKRAEALIEQGTPLALGEAGTLLAHLGELETAHGLLEKAVLPKDAPLRILNNLGNVKLILGQPKQALTLYERALERNPELREVRMNAVVAAVIAKSDRLNVHLLELSPKDLRGLWQRAEGRQLQPAARRVAAPIRDEVRAVLATRLSLDLSKEQTRALGANDVDWPQLLHWL